MRLAQDIFLEVLLTVRANKLRSFLTMFGVAWGVGSLLLLIGLGEGFRSGQHRQLASLGSDVILMGQGSAPAVPSQHIGMRGYHLTVSDEAAIRAQAPAVLRITAVLQNSTIKEVSDASSSGGAVLGVEPNYRQVRYLPMLRGRFLEDQDLERRRRVIVLGRKAAALLFPDRPAVGDGVLLNGARFEVIGVADRNRNSDDIDEERDSYVPLTTMLQIFPLSGDNLPQGAVTTLQYQPRSRGDDTAAVAQVHRIVARQHGFDPDSPDAFNEYDTIEAERSLSKIFDQMDLFLGGVGLVTLALGAVGVVNIMLVSVAERTREIGLRKALGATNRSIMSQFLMEALLLTGLSGAIGAAFATLFMLLLDHTLGENGLGFDPPRLVPWSAAVGVAALALSGAIAGVLPALQAARLDPVAALRQE